MRDAVKSAVIWRSGSQILAQTVAWGSTLAVIRILAPSDYGIFAMTQVVMAFLSFLGGYGFASSLIQDRNIDRHKIRQAFGLLLLINAAIALLQLGLAPLAAHYYRAPIVAELLAMQALIYLATPFIALPEVLFIREMDFKRPAIANFTATIISAIVAITCALSDFGVWTLIFAPLSAFWVRAIMLMVLARFNYWPSFQFKGAGKMFNFGLMLLASHFFWTIVTQADIFIAARSLSPAELGFYAEALFLTSLVAIKFVPALNQVAFPAYAQLQDDPAALRFSFLKAARLIMLVTCPLFFGLAATAPDTIYILLGEKWLPIVPIAIVLAFAMPALTLHTIFAPVINAKGHPKINMQASLFGACIMPPAYFIGVQWGGIGLAWAWVIGFPLLPLFTFLRSRNVLGISGKSMIGAIAPGIAASGVMAGLVMGIGMMLPSLHPIARLIIMIASGGLIYGGLLYCFSREILMELIRLVAKRKLPEQAEQAKPQTSG